MTKIKPKASYKYNYDDSLIPDGVTKLLHTKKIDFYPRFFSVGKSLVYYENIIKFDETDRDKGKVTLHFFRGGDQKRISIHKKHFPTNARKDFKIEANKQAKFDRTLELIKKQRLAVRQWQIDNGYVKPPQRKTT